MSYIRPSEIETFCVESIISQAKLLQLKKTLNLISELHSTNRGEILTEIGICETFLNIMLGAHKPRNRNLLLFVQAKVLQE